MKIDKFGCKVYLESDIVNALMCAKVQNPGPFLMSNLSDEDKLANDMLDYPAFQQYEKPEVSIQEYDKQQQDKWFMPQAYKDMDIAKYILDLCDGEAELQRCGEELLMYQDRNLFDLLRYLVFLVDTITKNDIILGVGRGSSVSSFVLYKLKVHRVNSLYYKLSIDEFLR